jgi:hypothetical protein
MDMDKGQEMEDIDELDPLDELDAMAGAGAAPGPPAVELPMLRHDWPRLEVYLAQGISGSWFIGHHGTGDLVKVGFATADDRFKLAFALSGGINSAYIYNASTLVSVGWAKDMLPRSLHLREVP